MRQVPEISPTQFSARWSRIGGDVVLLDVREPDELAVASVAGALHIPMRQVPARLDELDAGRPLVVMCHAGGRSRRVAEFLSENGFEQVYNLAGGIDAWSVEIDPQIPRY
jgi:rhodanese-related sulfurtransferase